MATGHKTKNGVLGEDSTAVPGIRHGKRLTTILEMARSSGRSTGLVTTTHITHATPAGFYAHWYDRDQETVIAEALINANVSVLMGGGRAFFLPQTARDPEDGLPGERKDGANLIDSLVAQGYRYAWNKSGFDSIDARRTKRLLGLFEFAHMEFEADRPQDVAGEPSLSEMTGKTLEILSRNPKGFFLMVEAGRIDHAAHALDADRWVSDILACDQAIGVALDFARKDGKTLLVVAPDHGTGGPAYIGQRGHDPEGPVETTGFPDYVDSNGDGFPDNVPRRPMAIGWASSPTFTKDTTYVGDHVADDVPIFAYGPGSERVHGALDNTDVFRIMAAAIGVK
jgi:alkaline phosphatase